MMTHSDYIWIAIRIFGIYLVIQAVFSLVGLVSSIATLVAILPISDVSQSFIRPTTVGRIISSLVAVLFYAWLARYFLMDGRRVYSWVDLRLPTEFRGASTS